jgi:SAM-dependent methyltransferase
MPGGSDSERLCAVCGGAGRILRRRQRFALIEGVSVCGGYDVVTCDRCSFGYAAGGPTQPELDAYYERASKYENPLTRGAPSQSDLLRFAPVARQIAQAVANPRARVVEVGCSTGGLLHLLARDHGFTHLRGLDPSAACVSAARELHGLDATRGSLWDLPSMGPCDVIVLQQVLEHVIDLEGALDALLAALEPGGFVCVEVPDVAAFPPDPEPPFQQFSVEHMNFFSAASLANLFARCGLALRAPHPDGSAANGSVFGAFQRGATAPVPDRTTVPALRRYVELCGARERLLGERVREMLRDGEPVFVWCIGTLTLSLLETSALGQAPIRAFVDSNPRYHGKSIRGTSVIAPAEVTAGDTPILLVTREYAGAIRAEIRELRLPNPVRSIYP